MTCWRCAGIARMSLPHCTLRSQSTIPRWARTFFAPVPACTPLQSSRPGNEAIGGFSTPSIRAFPLARSDAARRCSLMRRPGPAMSNSCSWNVDTSRRRRPLTGYWPWLSPRTVHSPPKRLKSSLTHSTDPHSPGLVQLTGPALFLTRDPDLRLAQLTTPGAIDYEFLLDEPLLDNISTDEIIPGWCCYWYDEKLGDYAYLGLRDGVVGEGSVRSLHPQVVVSGASKGCGSSREHAVYAERFAGIDILFADSFEKIYEQNCRNVGILTCDDRDILRALLAGDALPLSAFTQRLNAIERTIIDAGGLFKFNSRHRESPSLTVELGPERPMNCVEKIIQRHLPAGPSPTGCVVVGGSYFVTADVRFSHEYVTPMAAGMFDNEFGTDAPLADPSSCLFFQDHLSLASNVLARRPNGAQLTDRVNRLHRRQYEFATDKGGLFVGTLPTGGSEAICHNYILEKVARPGQIVIGTDS